MRLYKAEYVETDAADEWDEETSETFPDPEGWAEHCQELWGVYRPFFPPTARPIYRSRSAAQRRVDLINRWLGHGTAVLAEADVRWTPTADANARRAHTRKLVKIAKLRAQIADLEAERPAA